VRGLALHFILDQFVLLEMAFAVLAKNNSRLERLRVARARATGVKSQLNVNRNHNSVYVIAFERKEREKTSAAGENSAIML